MRKKKLHPQYKKTTQPHRNVFFILRRKILTLPYKMFLVKDFRHQAWSELLITRLEIQEFYIILRKYF
jgi:hypothetical protein